MVAKGGALRGSSTLRGQEKRRIVEPARPSSADEALVVDHATADVTNHDTVLLAHVAAGDVLLVHDIFTDACLVENFTVELWVLLEDLPNVRGGCVAACHKVASRVFDDADR